MANNDIMATEQPPSPEHQLTGLIQALDQAALMARQLPASNPAHLKHILSSLHSAHISLSSFLSSHSAEHSVDEPMRDKDDGEEEEQNSNSSGVDYDDASSMERIEEKMRESLHIQNKRPKRPLSPSAAVNAEQLGLEERENVTIVTPEFDPHGSRLRNLVLVYQFHV